jgi:DNA anti-recombination protein RmuC
MSEKDLGELTENFEEEVEKLKNTRMKIFGITMTPTTIGAAFAIVSSIIGGLYGAFQVYDDYMGMKEIVQNIDVEAIAAENALVIQKMEENMLRIEDAIDYTRDIKSGLRDDILGIEKQVDRVEDKLREQEADVRDIIQNAEERFENKRDALQNDYDERANNLRDSNDQRMSDLEEKVERDLKILETDLNNRLQRALDNPLAN